MIEATIWTNYGVSLNKFINIEPTIFFTLLRSTKIFLDSALKDLFGTTPILPHIQSMRYFTKQTSLFYKKFQFFEELNTSAKSVDFSTCSDRQLLYETWVKLKNLIKYQPLDLIQKYYGTKIAFYFAWLGFYTRCLYPVSVLGILCVIYGLWSMGDDIPR